MYVMGIDVGTGGVRVVVSSSNGEVPAQAAQPFQAAGVAGLPPDWHEQYVEPWWPAVAACIREVIAHLGKNDIPAAAITAAAVTSTSGTVLPLDGEFRPLHPAIMYNDGRGAQEARDLNTMAPEFVSKMGRGFPPAFALPKILWVKRHLPEVFARTRRWVHAADFIVGKMTGEYGASDTSTALKTGYDVIDLCWPEFIESQAGIPLRMLPRVIQPGEEIARVTPACSTETGLAPGTRVCGGMTDANTALLATGATGTGDWNTTLGTTITIKGITEAMLRDARSGVYCHRHPMGWWLPGSAGNVGGECLQVRFRGGDLAALDAAAAAHGPASVVVYPLVRRGERFPFVHSTAEGFILGEPQDEVDLYRGYLEGVGLTERLAYAVLEGLGATTGSQIYVAGGGTRSRTWLQIRADILGKTLLKPELPESALGAAILAASQTLFSDVVQAGRHMVRLNTALEPDLQWAAHYAEKYFRFTEALRSRGYLS